MLLNPTLMSEEEEEEGKIRRKRPSWRSEEFNSALDDIDKRADGSSKTARKERTLGSPVRLPPPDGLLPWMLAAQWNFFFFFCYIDCTCTCMYHSFIGN